MATETRQHRTDPAEGGWDTNITRAPDSHKAGSAARHRHAAEKNVGKKALRILGIVVLILIALAAAVALGLFIALNITGSLR